MSKCQHCGRETNNPKYCSRSCAVKVNNLKPKRSRTKKCRRCKTLILSNYTYCSKECQYPQRAIQEKQTIKDVVYTKYHRSSAYSLIRARARKVMKDHKSCQKCGYDKHVEIAHIRPISDWPENTLVSTVNSPENLMALCPNCHWELDHPS